MYFNPYEAQLLAKERMKDALREAEQEGSTRIRGVKSDTKASLW